MAITYAFEPGNNLGVITCSGEVTMEDRHVFISKIIDEDLHPNGANILINVSDVKNAPSPSEVPFVSWQIERLKGKGVRRVAILNTAAGHLTISHFIALQVGIDSVKTKVFMFESQAREWLNA